MSTFLDLLLCGLFVCLVLLLLSLVECFVLRRWRRLLRLVSRPASAPLPKPTPSSPLPPLVPPSGPDPRGMTNLRWLNAKNNLLLELLARVGETARATLPADPQLDTPRQRQLRQELQGSTTILRRFRGDA